MKRFLTTLLILLLAVSLVACGQGDVEEPDDVDEPADNGEEPSGDKTVLDFAVQADSTPALEKLVEAFNESSQEYEVKATVMTNDSGQMHDQLINSLSSQSGEYDIISMDVVWAGEFASAGYIKTIDELLMENDWKPTDFNAGSMDSGKYKGKNYVVPYFPDVGFIYFRKDIVSEEDANTLKSGDYSFDDFIALCEKYQGEGDTKYAYAFQAKQYEGLTVNINEFSSNWEDIEGGLKYMKEMIDKDLLPDDILNYTEGETANAFVNGEAVFARNWPYVNGMIQSDEHDIKIDQVDYAPLPGGGSVGGWILGVNANSENIKGAEEFISFLAGPEGQKINAIEGSYLPGYNALLEDEEVLEINKLLTNEGFTNALSNSISRPVVANYSEVSDKIQIAVHECLSDNGSLEDAVAKIEEALEE